MIDCMVNPADLFLGIEPVAAPDAADAPVHAAPLFQIDFSGEANADPFVPANYGCTEDMETGNDGRIVDGRLTMDSAGDDQSFHADIGTLDLDGREAFYAEITNYICSEASATDGGALMFLNEYDPGAWSVANAYGSANGYYFEIGSFSSHGRVNVWRVVNGVGSFLTQWTPGSGYPIAAGIDYRFEIAITGGATGIVVKANGVQVISYNDSHAQRFANLRTVGMAMAYASGPTSLAALTVDAI